VTPVCVSVIVTFAPGTTAPEASVMVPSIVALTTCDHPAGTTRHNSSANKAQVKPLGFIC
jgi:hypothetical protein